MPRPHPPPRSISPTPSTVSRFATSDLFLSPPDRASRSRASTPGRRRWKLRRSTRCSSRKSRRTSPSTSLSARRRSQSSSQRVIRRILLRDGREPGATEVRPISRRSGPYEASTDTGNLISPLRWASSCSASARHGGHLRLGVQRDGTPRSLGVACKETADRPNSCRRTERQAAVFVKSIRM